VLASGEGSVAQALFDAVTQSNGLLYGRVSIPLVISENPDAGVLQRAAKSGLNSQVVEFRQHLDRAQWERELEQLVASVQPWLVVSAGFMRILSPSFVIRFRIINTHPSLLPSFPGAHAVRDTLAAGARESGCTLHYVDAGVDTGAIIAQRTLQISPQESQAELHERIKVLERELIVTGILGLLEGGH
jgi:phosphoribosylglycinamide formyltransferase-1